MTTETKTKQIFAKHIITPLTVKKGAGLERRHYFYSSDGYCLGTTQGNHSEANAEFIVKACNEYYKNQSLLNDAIESNKAWIGQNEYLKSVKNELVEALRECLYDLEEISGKNKDEAYQYPNAILQAKQALEKAGG